MFVPNLADKLLKDVMAGLTVCAVALPLALAFGVSSGASGCCWASQVTRHSAARVTRPASGSSSPASRRSSVVVLPEPGEDIRLMR